MNFIRDGLPPQEAKNRYKNRREDFVNRIKGPVLIFGVADEKPTYFWQYHHQPFNQDPLFLYLTGINQSGCALYMDKNSHILFLPPHSEKTTFWEGDYFSYGPTSVKKLQNTLGFEYISPIKALKSTVLESLSSSQSQILGMNWYETKENKAILKDIYWKQKENVNNWLKKASLNTTIINIAAHQFDTRLCLDDIDQKNCRQAQKITENAFIHVLKTLHNYSTETEIAASLEHELSKNTALKTSFPLIVASGKNACTLHYVKNNTPLSSQDLLLLDFGCRVNSMLSDISRTIPLSGTFSPLQALLYTVVLDTQKKVETCIHPGQTIAQINELCWETLEGLLEERFFSKGGKASRPYKKAPHFVSHLIAQAVHDGDPSRNYQTLPMKSGWVLSNEPGLYGTFEMTIEGTHYKETLGIRIEDNILVTDSGNHNLSQDIPKSIEAIESILSIARP